MTWISKFFKNSNDTSKKNIRSLIKKYILSLFGLVILYIFWESISLIVTSRDGFENFVGFRPYNAIKALFSLFNSFSFWSGVLLSLFRIIIGLFISSVIAIPSGLFIGFYKNLRELTNLPIQLLRMISPLAWLPIALIIFPGFNIPIIFLISISTIWPILLNTSQGVLNIQPQWINAAQNQGANDKQLLTKVILPASLPYILSGFRLAIGVAWIVLIPAELLGGVTSGLGYLIGDARDTFKYDDLVAIIIAIGIIGFFIDFLSQTLLNKIDWRKK